jgi:hypothetical protein
MMSYHLATEMAIISDPRPAMKFIVHSRQKVRNQSSSPACDAIERVSVRIWTSVACAATISAIEGDITSQQMASQTTLLLTHGSISTGQSS